MPTSTADSAAEPEVLIKRRQPWWRLMWVQILVSFVLMWVVTGVLFWSQSRSAWAVFRVNGMADEPQASRLTSFRQASGLSSYLSEFFVQDRLVVHVWLIYTAVDDQWLVHLRRFPRLERASLDGGQIGPGLKNLADLPALKVIMVEGRQRRVANGWIDFVDSTISGRHFLAVPQLESLGLSGFKGTISDLYQLQQHPHLNAITLADMSQLSDVLRQIENCQNIKSLRITQKDLDEDSLASLCRMSHLSTLTIQGITKTEPANSQLQQALPNTNIICRP